jgi:hypothetical protein
MPRPKSIFEQFTKSSLPPPEQVERRHLVIQGEHPMGVANREYQLSEYDPTLWRNMLIANGIDNPFLFSAPEEEGGNEGRQIVIPAKPLPTFD